MNIKIIRVPEGDAPLWVREKWVGVVIPLPKDVPNPYKGEAVSIYWEDRLLYQVRYFFTRLFGYAKYYEGWTVRFFTAVEALHHSAPEAAKWWMENCKNMLYNDRQIVFQLSECELLAGNAWEA